MRAKNKRCVTMSEQNSPIQNDVAASDRFTFSYGGEYDESAPAPDSGDCHPNLGREDRGHPGETREFRNSEYLFSYGRSGARSRSGPGVDCSPIPQLQPEAARDIR